MPGADHHDIRHGAARADDSADDDRGELDRLLASGLIRKPLWQAGLASLILNLLSLITPLYFTQVYDRVLSSRSEATLLAITIVTLVVIGLNAAFDLLRNLLCARASAGLYAELEQRGFAAGALPCAMMDLLYAPLFLIALFVIHEAIGLLALAVAIGLILMMLVNRASMARVTSRSVEGFRYSSDVAEASLRGIEPAIAMGFAARIEARAAAINREAIIAQMRGIATTGSIGSAVRAVRSACQILVIALAAYLALEGAISMGAIIAASILFSKALAPLDQVVGGWRTIFQVRSAWRRLAKLLGAAPPERQGMRLPPPKGALAVQAIDVVAPGGQTVILQAISFELKAGEALGIIGASGSGKSTLARVLTGAWLPARGVVRLDGADMAQIDLDAMGAAIGYVPQTIELLPGTIGENIRRFGADDPEGVVAAAMAAGAHEMILAQPRGYDTNIGGPGFALSGGQRQRVGLARALYGDPALLILDEPDSGLDRDGEHALTVALAAARARRDDHPDRPPAVAGGPARQDIAAGRRPGAALRHPRRHPPQAGRPTRREGAGMMPSPIAQAGGTAAEGLADHLSAPTRLITRRIAILSGVAATFILLWAIFVPIASGAIAPGHVVVAEKRKTLQHLDGGIVREIAIREGETVRQGSVLLRLDDTDAKLSVAVLQSQLDSLHAERAARQAELTGARNVSFPADLLARASDPAVNATLRAQRAAFEARRANMTGRQSQLGERVTQITEDAGGARAQARARAEQIALLEGEIRDTEALVEKGFATRPRLLALKRAAAALRGEQGALEAQVASSRETLIETRQVARNAGATAADALRSIQGELVQVVEKLAAARQILARKEIRAPVSGTVVALNVTTLGGVVRPGDPLLDIVPSQRKLVIAAQIAPMHGDDVRAGQPVFVRFDAIGARKAPILEGTVQTFSADALVDARTGQTYFEAVISITDQEAARLPPDLLKPGLPAEILIKTGESTLAYLLAPLTGAAFHAMRE